MSIPQHSYVAGPTAFISKRPGSARSGCFVAKGCIRILFEYSPARPFFVEFARATPRATAIYTCCMARRMIVMKLSGAKSRGFFPLVMRNTGASVVSISEPTGHVLPVPSEIGASDGDLEEQYVLARFRIWIDREQYQRLVAYINDRKAHLRPWKHWSRIASRLDEMSRNIWA